MKQMSWVITTFIDVFVFAGFGGIGKTVLYNNLIDIFHTNASRKTPSFIHSRLNALDAWYP